jgi:hypothetical protein
MVRVHASLGPAQKDRGERQWRGSLAACGDRGQSKQPAEACLACPDHPADGRNRAALETGRLPIDRSPPGRHQPPIDEFITRRASEQPSFHG